MSEQSQGQWTEIKPVNLEELIRRVLREELERMFPDQIGPWPRYVAKKDYEE